MAQRKITTGILILWLFSLVTVESGCRAKSCPDYQADRPSGFHPFRKKSKVSNGLFTPRQRRYYR